MLELNDADLVAHMLRLVNDMNDPNSWDDPNHYAALTVAFQDTRAEILRRMNRG
jgi:hypothetical protein